MSLIRVKRSGSSGSPAALAQGEMAYSYLGGTQSNGGDRLYIGTGTETGGVAANIEVIGGKYFTSKLSHVPGVLTNGSAVIVDSSGKIDTFNATSLTANTFTLTTTLSANGSVGTAGQVLTSSSTGTYWSTVAGTNLGQSANSSTISVTSSTGTGTILVSANSTTAGLLSADAQTIAGVKTFSSTISGSINGNAGTATTLQTARNINGVSFNGSADITITANAPNALTFNNGGAGAVSGSTFNGSAAVTISYNTIGASPLAGSTSLTTTGTVTTGTWSASFGAVSGANLTNLTAGNLSGTIPSAVLGNSSLFVGTTSIALNRASTNLGLTGITSVTLPGSTSGSVQIIPTAVAGTGTVLTLPATTGTVVTTGDTGTVTSTMIANGTIVNTDISDTASIAITKLAASTISGVSLGGTLGTLTLGSYLTGTSYNGSGAVTAAVDATNLATASKVVARDASGNFAANTITANLTGTASSANNSAYLGGTAAASYQLNSTLSANVATLAANSATYANSSVSNTFTVGTGTYFVSNGNVGIANSAPADKLSVNGTAYFSGNIRALANVQIDGTLTVGGNTTIVNATNLSVADNMIYLNNGVTTTITGAVANGSTFVYTANNNYSTSMVVTVTGVSPSGYNVTSQSITAANSTTFTIANATAPGAYVSGGSAIAKTSLNPDLGFAGAYNDGTYAHAGIFRDASDGYWKFFHGYTPEPDASVFIDTSNTSFTLSTVQANTFIGALSGVATSANTLTTSRNINGTAFNGSADITITANTSQNLTFNNGGAGAASGSTFNGGTAVTVSYNTVGASPLAGSTSLTTLGTVTTGTWNGSVVTGTYGGTGINNGAKTITLGGNISTANSFTSSGNFALTLTTTAATNVTLPTTGTLATLAGSETLTNKTLTLPTIGGTGAVFNGSTSGTTTLLASAAAGTTTITLPATTGTVVTTGDTGTVTSTMIADGTIVNADINASAAIAVSKLAASTISGITLGNNLGTLTFGTGLTAGGSTYNGSTGVTITAVTANNTALGVASFDSTNFTVTSGAVSINTIDGGTY